MRRQLIPVSQSFPKARRVERQAGTCGIPFCAAHCGLFLYPEGLSSQKPSPQLVPYPNAWQTAYHTIGVHSLVHLFLQQVSIRSYALSLVLGIKQLKGKVPVLMEVKY